MTDFANLGLRFVPVDDAAANKALTDVAANSTKAESATKKLTATQAAAANAQKAVAQAAQAQAAAVGQMGEAMQVAAAQQAASIKAMESAAALHGKVAGATKITAAETLNLSRQFADVAVTGAMGMSPLMILIQQGPQIGETIGAISTRAGGMSAALKLVAISAWEAVAPFAPFIAAAGLLAAAIGGPLLMATHELNKGNDDLQKRLGLTDEQMKKAGNTAVTVSDVIQGTFKYAAKAIGEQFAPQITWLQKAFSAAYEFIKNATVSAVKVFAGLWGAQIAVIQALWHNVKAFMKGEPLIDVNDAALKGFAEGVSRVERGMSGLAVTIREVRDARVLEAAGTAKATKELKDHTKALEDQKEALDRTQPITADMSKAVDLTEVKAVKMTAAIRELNGELKQMPVYIDPAVTAMEDFLRSFDRAGYGIDQLFNGLKNRDWIGAVSGLLKAAQAVTSAFKTGTTADKIGSIAGIAGAAGQAIGGTAGSTLSGAAGGAMAGFTLGGPVGAAIGAVVGGIVGIFSASSQKKAQKEAAAQAAREAEAQRQAQILQQRRQIEVAYVEATGTALEILEAQRKAELEGIDESNKAMALALYAAQDQKRRDEEGIALMRQLQAMDDAVLGTTTALTAARQEELKALDPANRYLAELIYARQDEAAAIEKGTALINAQLAYEADAQATWLRDVTNTRKEELAARKVMETAAQEAAKVTAEAFQTLVEKVNASRQAMLRAGDVAGAVGGDFSIGKSDPKLTDPNFNVRAIGELSLIRQRLDNLASADALNIQDVGSVIRRVFDQRYDDANVSARQDIIAGLSGGLGLVVRDAIAGLGTFLGDSQIRSRYQARGSGLASVYAASDDYNMVAQQNFIPTAPGEGISSFGADVGAYQLALAQLDGQLRKGTISQDQYGQAVDRVNEMVGASLIELANSTELQLARIDAAAEGLRQAGINSVVYYFGEITKAADALAVASKAANEPISQVTAAIGRLNSISTALGLSASAAGGGDARIDQAKLIAEAARVASQTLTTADAARIAKELAANDNFAGLSTTGLRDIAMLLDGLKAFDPNSFEASFLRLNNALITGAVTSDQYSALFAKAMDVYSGAAEDAAAQAQALAAAAATQHQLDIRLLRARGQDAAAIAIEQADELAAAANDNQRATLRMIYAEETLAKARREASAAAQASIDKFTGLRDNLRALQVELSRGAQAALSPEAQYLANKAEFDRVSGLAATRDATALAALPDTIRQFLDASKGYFATSQGYFTDLAAAQASAAGGENAAVTALDLAQQQLNTLDLINASVLGVQDAVLGLPVGSSTPTTSSAPSVVAPVADEETKQLLRELLVEVRASGIRVGAALTALLAKGDEIVEAEEGTTRAVRAA